MKAKLALSVVFSLCVAFSEGQVQTASVIDASTQYKAGQVWKYKTARGAEESRIVILEVQSREKNGSLVHVRIENLPVPHCAGLHFATTIGHLAVPEKVLRKSTTVLLADQANLPESYFDAYREWQKNRHKEIVKRPLAEVAVPEWGCPVIVNFSQEI